MTAPTKQNENSKKTYYAVFVDSVDARCVFPTREEAEEFRKYENSYTKPFEEPDASEVYEVEMTEEEYKNIPED